MEERIDKTLVIQGLVKSRTQAQKLIREKQVELRLADEWQVVGKVSQLVSPDCELRLLSVDQRSYVSRAGIKLAHAIAHCKIRVQAKRVLDIGQSTGGFTDCVLQEGCESVTGVDVGHGQLDPALRRNAKVRCIERLNARHLRVEDVGSGFDLVVMDLSFISQTLVLPRLPELMASEAILISLVKPQFEVGPQGVGKGGIVKNKNLYGTVEKKIRSTLNELNLQVIKYFGSPIAGGDGNKEFFVVAKNLSQ